MGAESECEWLIGHLGYECPGNSTCEAGPKKEGRGTRCRTRLTMLGPIQCLRQSHRPLGHEPTTVLSTLSPSPCILTRPELCAGTGLLGLNSRAAPKTCHHAQARVPAGGGTGFLGADCACTNRVVPI